MPKSTGKAHSLSVEWQDVSQLVPYARNPRKNDHAVDSVAASIKEFGWTQPIVVDSEGVVVAGHTRLKAAIKLGLSQVPVYSAKNWTEAQAKAYRIVDNKVAEKADWDTDLLSIELKELGEDGFDALSLGFGEDELATLMAEKTEGLTDPDEVPETPEEPVTVLGDVWQLGKHRIVCGDSTNADIVAKCLAGVTPHLMVTDPPYGVEYDANWRNEAERKNGKAYGASAVGKVENDNRADWREAWDLFPGDVAYVWHADKHTHTVAESLISSNFGLRCLIIWAKQQFAIGRGDYHHQHEPAWYAVRKGKKGHWNGDRKQSTVWFIDKPKKSETGHSTQKPVECMAKPIRNNSSPGQAIYEPFSGSGTTIIACEMEGRCCHAIELNPAYVDVTIKRWQEFTGQQAIHEESGQSFADMENAR